MKNVLLLDTSVGSLNQGDEIINISIKKNWSELFENNYIMNMALTRFGVCHLRIIFLVQKLEH